MSLVESESTPRVNHSLTIAGEQEQQIIEAQIQEERYSKLEHPSYRLTGHVGPIYSVKFSPNGNHMATGGKDGRVLIWDVYPSPVNMDVVNAHRGEILDLCFYHDNSAIVSVGTDRHGQIIDFETSTCVRELLHRSDVWGVAANGRGPHVLATATAQGHCYIWDDRQKPPTATMITNTPQTCISLSRDGDIAYTGGVNERITAWDLRMGTELYTLVGHNDTVTGLSLAADGSMLMSAGVEGSVRSWDTRALVSEEREATGRAIGIYAGHTSDRTPVPARCALSQDGSMVAAGSADGTAWVWAVDTYQSAYRLQGHKGMVCGIDVHPQEPIVASAGMDGAVVVTEVAKLE